MATYSLTGNDTLTLFGRSITDFADGDNFTTTFPNNLAEVKTGKNGNSLFAENSTGRQGEAILRLIRGSPDDKFLNSQLAAQLNDFATSQLAYGQFVKRVGNGAGVVTSDSYLFRSGIFSKQVEAKSNAEGDTEQSASVYNFKFANVQRAVL
jgi:hypothetical protein